MLTEEYRFAPKKIPYAKIYQNLLEIFQYDKDKTNAFWMSKIKELDNLSPFEMAKHGKTRELIKYINQARLR